MEGPGIGIPDDFLWLAGFVVVVVLLLIFADWRDDDRS
jgi:hypothetical protein